MEQNVRLQTHWGGIGMKVSEGTSLTNQPFFMGWYNSAWVSSRKENNKNKIAQKEIKKKMVSFKFPILEFLYNVNTKYSSLKTLPEISHKPTSSND